MLKLDSYDVSSCRVGHPAHAHAQVIKSFIKSFGEEGKNDSRSQEMLKNFLSVRS